MKHLIRRFKSLKIALKELEPFIRNGVHLKTGRPFEGFGGMRSREALANWLLCSALNAKVEGERFTFTSDPTGGDGIIQDRQTSGTLSTEHVMVPQVREGEKPDIQTLIVEQVALKQAKGGSAYASGKTLIVFLEVGGGEKWIPNRVARALPKTDFESVWVVGLEGVDDGKYAYNVTLLDASGGDAPIWRVSISRNFDAWTVGRLQ